MANRKLIRPNLAELKERYQNQNHGVQHDAPPSPTHQPSHHGNHHPNHHGGPPQSNPRHSGGRPGPRRKPLPPEDTRAEAFYYLKQMNNKTPMVVVLDNGEQLRGHIEWYDKACIKVHREDAPNLLIFKHAIRYLFKQEEEAAYALAEE